MNEKSYGEVLSHFKEMKNIEKVVSLIGDKNLINALLAWKSVTITYKETGLFCDSPSENEQWEWLWKNVKFDLQKFTIVAGLKVQDGTFFFERLKGLKLIYPDGTIDPFASQYLTSVIVKTLGLKNSDKPDKPDKKESVSKN